MIFVLLLITIELSAFPYEGSYCNKTLSTTFDMNDFLLLYNGTFDDGVVGDDIISILNTFPNSNSNYFLVASIKGTTPDYLQLGYIAKSSSMTSAMTDITRAPTCKGTGNSDCNGGDYCAYFYDGFGFGFNSDSTSAVDINHSDGYDKKNIGTDKMRLSWAINGDGGVRDGLVVNDTSYYKVIYVLKCKSYSGSMSCSTCITGFYNSSGNCFPCSRPCAACSTVGYDKCTLCNDDFTLFSNYTPYICLTNVGCVDAHCSWCFETTTTGQCLECETGYIATASKTCIKCPSPCDACYSNSVLNCSSCLITFYLNGTQCKSCHPACSTCFGGGANNCLVCLASYSAGTIIGSYNCTSNSCANTDCQTCVGALATDCIKCQDAYSIDIVPGGCTLCQYPCAKCSFNTTTCKSCVEGYYINATNCPQCSSNCINCTSHGYNMCIACKAIFNVAITGFSCTASSADCFDPAHCLNCLGTGEYECAKCIDDYVLYDSYAPSKCMLCPNYCLTCVANTNTACTSCQQGYFLQSGLCLICHDACLSCYGESATNCLLCATSFSTSNPVKEYNCTSTTLCEANCNICIRLNTATPATGNCVECGSSYYLASNTYPSTCSQCPTNCTECLNATFCTSCNSGYFFSQYKCLQCSLPCATCSAEGPDKCLTCAAGYASGIKGIFLCTTTSCAAGSNCAYCVGITSSDCIECNTYFAIKNSTLPNTCHSCPSPCLTCIPNPVAPTNVKCLSCVAHYYFSGNDCLQCHASCGNCTASGPLQCSTCDASYNLGAYLGYPCTSSSCAATSNCTRCIGSTTSDCIECQTTYYMVNSTIPNSCPKCPSPCKTCNIAASVCYDCIDGYYFSAGQCLSCHPSCSKCTASGANNCIATFCSGGTAYNISSSPYLCVKNSGCESLCILCIGNGPGDCLKCQSGASLATTSIPSTCSDCPSPCATCSLADVAYCLSCEAGYYLSGSTCNACHSSCATCSSDGADKCNTCSASPYINTGATYAPYLCTRANENCTSNCNICIENGLSECLICSTGYALNGSSLNKCLACPSPCTQCKYPSTTNCTACISHYFLSSTECKICHVSCLECTGPNSKNCSSCATNYATNILYPSYCVSTSVCSTGCSVCIGPSPSQCLKCNSGFYMIGSAPSTCGICTSPCVTCNISDTICLSCEDGYVLVGDKCPSCHSSCKNCTVSISPLSCDVCENTYILRNSFCTITSSSVGCKYSVGILDSDCIECTDNFYQLTPLTQCLQCTSPCYNCNGGGTGSCFSCISHFYLGSSVGPINCLICHSSCNNCTDGNPTSCTNCAAGYIKRSPNSTVCTHDTSCAPHCHYCFSSEINGCIECYSGFIFDGFENCRSSSCYTNCELCDNNTIAGCNSCFNPFYFNDDNICVTDQNCGQNCWECIFSNVDEKCTLCTSVDGIAYFLYQGLQISYCVTNISCAINCAYCLNSSTNGCLECKSGYSFMSTSDKRCVTNIDCGLNCDYCLIRNDNANCVSCIPGYGLFDGVDPSYCSHSTSCIVNCSDCIGPANDQCLKCNIGFTQINGICVTKISCGLNCDYCYYQNDDSKCVSCQTGFNLYNDTISYCTTQVCEASLHCLYCVANSSSGCIQCMPPYHPYSTLNPICIIETCFTNCKYCFSQDVFSCMECINSDMDLYSSVPTLCGYKYSCQANCKFCLSNAADQCVDCKPGYIMYNNKFPSYCSTQSNCQDLCNTCLDGSRCIDCKKGSYLDTDGLCKIQCKPGYLFNLTSPYCREICGDGKNMGAYECDDGNIIDGDGCDHNCKKEVNAICKTVNLLNQCIIPSYNISFLEGMYKVKVAFNYEVANLSDYVANMKAKIKDINGAEIMVPIISAIEMDSTTLELQLYLDNISASETDQLKLEFPGIPSYQYGTESIGTNEISTSAMALPKSSKAIGSHVLMMMAYIILGIHLVVMLVKHKSIYYIWEVLETFQLLSVLSVINIHKVPSYVAAILKYAAYSTFAFVPKMLSPILKTDKYYSTEFLYDKATTHPIIGSSSYIVNMSTYYAIYIAFAIFYAISRGAAKSQKQCINKSGTRIVKACEYSLFLRAAFMFELPLFMCSWMQLRFINLGLGSIAGIGVALSILSLLAGLVWIVGILLFIIKKKTYMNSTEYKARYGEIYERYSLNGKAPITVVISIARKILIAYAITLPSKPFMQALIILLTNSLYLVWLLIARPYKQREDMISSIASEICILLSLIVIIFLNSAAVFIKHYNVVSCFGVIFLLGAAYSKTIVALIKAIAAIREKNVVIPLKRMDDISTKSLKNDESMVDDPKFKEDTEDKSIVGNQEFRTTQFKYQKSTNKL